MRNIFRIAILMVTAAMVACGGGGGGGGTPTGPAATLRVYPPIGAITMPVGAAGSTGIEVRGGVGPYGVISSDASVSAMLSSDNILLLSSSKQGSSEVTVYDASLPVQQVKINVTTQTVPMVSSVGTAINLNPGESKQFDIRGGVAPYAVTSSDASIVTVSGSNGGYTIVGQNNNGTATILITDSVGATLSIAVTVKVVALTAQPNKVAGIVGGSGSVQILGGLAPFTVTFDNVSVATASASGRVVNVTYKAPGAANLVIVDAAGQSATVPVAVTANVLVLAPAAQTVLETQNDNVTIMISGGVPPYTPVMSLAQASLAKATISGNTLTIGVGSAGNRCVSADTSVIVDVYDAQLTKQTATLTIKDGAPTACP